MEKADTPLHRDTSIRWKFVRIVLVTCGVVIVSVCLVLLIYDAVSSLNALESQLSVLAEVIGLNTTAALEFQDANAASRSFAFPSRAAAYRGSVRLHARRRRVREICSCWRQRRTLFLRRLNPTPKDWSSAKA